MTVPYKLEPYDINELKKKAKRKPAKNYVPRNGIATIEEFVRMGNDCCRVCSCKDKDQAHIECTILNRSVKSAGYSNSVGVVVRGSDVYLVKKDMWKKLMRKEK